MQHGRDHEDRIFHARKPRATNVPPDEPATDLEAELLTSGRHHMVPREGVIGAHESRPARTDPDVSGMETEEPPGPGLDVGPTEKAARDVKERHRREQEGKDRSGS